MTQKPRKNGDIDISAKNLGRLSVVVVSNANLQDKTKFAARVSEAYLKSYQIVDAEATT